MDRVASNQMGPGPGATTGPVVDDHRTADSVLAALGLAVLVVDADQNLVAANPEGVALLGGNLEVVRGRPLLGLMAPVDAEACLESALAVVLAGGDRSLELEAVLPGGRRVWLDLALRPVPGPDGAVGGAVISARDVSLPRARERALRESETRFRALIQRAKDVSVILDREATVIYASPGAVLLPGPAPPIWSGSTAGAWSTPTITVVSPRTSSRSLPIPVRTRLRSIGSGSPTGAGAGSSRRSRT